MEPAPPEMETGPSKVIEALVGLLIPAACREHVLGDLRERFKCSRQYVADAASTVPLVIVSRIRRTTDPQVLLMEAFAVYASFLFAAWQLHQMSFLQEQEGLLRLAIPTAVTLAALMLVDAYARPEKRWPVKPMLQAAFAIAFAVFSQAALVAAYPAFAVPFRIMVLGGGMSLLLVSALRMLFAPGDHRPRGAS